MILVDFDMPKNCRECPIIGCIYHAVNDTRPDLCPIVREVKRGRWIGVAPEVDTEQCSLCGYNILSEELETPFCPWCGVDMREDGE